MTATSDAATRMSPMERALTSRAPCPRCDAPTTATRESDDRIAVDCPSGCPTAYVTIEGDDDE